MAAIATRTALLMAALIALLAIGGWAFAGRGAQRSPSQSRMRPAGSANT